ncbi:unnamed protein product [Meganyctiphanes norvegica]|uniref:Protein quiver n=1 Tax=Meganyctiphanes norvegica TaxID=48144 RepID=A0AAV2Q793_MEGNR
MRNLIKPVGILFLLFHVGNGLFCYECIECPYTNNETETNYRVVEGGEWINFTSCTALTITDISSGEVKVYRNGDISHSVAHNYTNNYYCVTDLCNGHTKDAAISIAAPSLLTIVVLLALNILHSLN